MSLRPISIHNKMNFPIPSISSATDVLEIWLSYFQQCQNLTLLVLKIPFLPSYASMTLIGLIARRNAYRHMEMRFRGQRDILKMEKTICIRVYYGNVSLATAFRFIRR